MGVSDRAYFAWVQEALQQFEAESGRLATVRREGRSLELWVLAGSRMTPPADFVLNALGRETTTVRLLDKFARTAGVSPVDFNALEAVAENSCDVLFMTRASYMIENPSSFLRDARRIVRPGGLVIIDWLHGFSDAPVLDLPGHHEYEGHRCPFLTTYCDSTVLADFSREFEAFIRHVNRPPSWVNLEQPGAPVAVSERVRRLLGGPPRRQVTLASYLDTLRTELNQAGKHLVEPALMEQYFKVVFRHARYFYPMVKKFNLHVLTVLQPVGK